MITYDKSRKAWNFKDANEDEKEAMMELAEAIWAKTMAFQIAQQMMGTILVEDPDAPTEVGISVPSNKEPTESIVIPFPSKEKH